MRFFGIVFCFCENNFYIMEIFILILILFKKITSKNHSPLLKRFFYSKNKKERKNNLINYIFYFKNRNKYNFFKKN